MTISSIGWISRKKRSIDFCVLSRRMDISVPCFKDSSLVKRTRSPLAMFSRNQWNRLSPIWNGQIMKHEIINAHRMVAHIAEEMAQALYEELAKNDAWYAQHQDRADAIKGMAPSLRQEARKVLAEMLGDEKTSQYDKERIYEALVNDRR